MGEAVLVVVSLLLCLGAGVWTHSMAKGRRWVFAGGILVACCGIGLACYGMALAATDLNGLVWAIAALFGAAPAAVGAAVGIATGAWAGRRA